MGSPTPVPYGLARSSISILVVVVASIVWVQGLAAVLRHLGPSENPPAHALALTVAAVAVGALGSIGGLRMTATAASALGGFGGAAAMLTLAATGLVHWITGLSLLLVGGASGALTHAMASRLPEGFEAAVRRQRLVVVAWIVLALLTVLQMGRLATFVADPDFDWFLGTRHVFWYKHLCIPAYIYGAELNERGDPNVYKAEHYLALNRDAVPETRFDMVPEDPYQYPPPFLLLPRLAIWLSDDFQSIYAVWFAIQTTAFLAIAISLALWVGGRTGTRALFLLPLSLLAFPTLYTLQFGQFHLATIVLAIAAMLAFDRGRNGLGGSLLGFAILAKIFPGILLVWMVVRKRWVPVAWTLAACVTLSFAGLLLLGAEPFDTFFTYQLPRLSSGTAFALDAADPELQDFVITTNQSYLGAVQKLGVLGLPGMTKPFAATFGKFFGVIVLAITFFAARRSWRSRADQVAAWLSLVGLGSLAGAGGWAESIPLPALWLLTFMAARMVVSRKTMVTLSIFWFILFFMIGNMPFGSWFSLPVMASLSLVGSISLHAFYLVVLLGTALRMESLDEVAGLAKSSLAEPSPAAASQPSI